MPMGAYCTWGMMCPSATATFLQVLRLEGRVLELELHGNHASQGCAAPVTASLPTAQGPGPADHHQVQVTLSTGRAWREGVEGNHHAVRLRPVPQPLCHADAAPAGKAKGWSEPPGWGGGSWLTLCAPHTEQWRGLDGPPCISQLQGDANQALECHQAQQQALEARV